ncbi:biopolymer transporter ExbD [Dysgonomonas sp. ZJ709]|uniref:ExbD/TolR family protein n=1 Tax=Dysgonomonas sp. ZJ709 TaxID=2709797 RepID=UPI0013ECA99A|nr:biopolymer transporter ExbD [Dysgonomonas sp. ZJ709]
MANINSENRGGNGKRNKMTRKLLSVDFTPMVDMNMLLICFFMFCTTLSMPQVMDIAVPAKDTENTGATEIPQSRTLTFILGEDDKVYYYAGIADYDNFASLKATDYEGMRNVLLERNAVSIAKIRELKQKRYQKQISDQDYKIGVEAIKKSDESIIAVIKPTNDSSFRNLVDALDEMQICGVGVYALVDMAEGDNYLVENYKTKGALTAENK